MGPTACPPLLLRFGAHLDRCWGCRTLRNTLAGHLTSKPAPASIDCCSFQASPAPVQSLPRPSACPSCARRPQRQRRSAPPPLPAAAGAGARRRKRGGPPKPVSLVPARPNGRGASRAGAGHRPTLGRQGACGALDGRCASHSDINACAILRETFKVVREAPSGQGSGLPRMGPGGQPLVPCTPPGHDPGDADVKRRRAAACRRWALAAACRRLPSPAAASAAAAPSGRGTPTALAASWQVSDAGHLRRFAPPKARHRRPNASSARHARGRHCGWGTAPPTCGAPRPWRRHQSSR